jgi:hypothetical protein
MLPIVHDIVRDPKCARSLRLSLLRMLLEGENDLETLDLVRSGLCSTKMNDLILQRLAPQYGEPVTEILQAVASQPTNARRIRKLAAELLMERGDPEGPILLREIS